MLRHSLCCTIFTLALCIAAPLPAQDDPFHGFDPFAEPAAAKKKQPTAKATAQAPAHPGVKLLATSSEIDPEERPHYAISQGLPTNRDLPAVQKIRQTLKRHVDISMTMVPLIDFAEAVEEATGIMVWLDQPLLDGVGIGVDEPTTLNIKGVSLESALRLVLRDMNLTFVIRDEVLLFTPEDSGCGNWFTKVYRIDDLFQPVRSEPGKGPLPGQFEKREAQANKIMDLLKTSVAPESWDNVGGPGSLSNIVIRDTCLLTISQHPDVHEHIAGLLETFRDAALPAPPIGKAKKQKPVKTDAAKSNPVIPEEAAPEAKSYMSKDGGVAVKMLPKYATAKPRPFARISQGLPKYQDTPVVQKVQRALQQHVDIHLIEVPLSDVVADLQKTTGINILLDQPALDGVGIEASTPVTAVLEDISLKSVLRLILRDMELVFLIRDEALQITTPEEAECQLLTRVYRIEDLLQPGQVTPRKGDYFKQIDELEEKVNKIIDFLTTTVTPESWSDVGGPGAVSEISIRDRCLLVISQTQDVHPEIADLLETVREAALPAPAAKLKQPVAKPHAIEEEPPEPLPVDAALNKPPAPIQQVAAGEEVINRTRKILVRMLPQKVTKKKPEPYTAISRGVTLKKPSAAVRKIEAALDAVVSVDFLLTPLNDVARDVATAAGINVLLDKAAMDGVGITPTAPVTRSIKGVTLRSALHNILREMELAFIIQDDVLKITTPEVTESNETTRLYAIEDFAPGGMPDLHAAQLQDIITCTIAPEAWGDGTGSPTYDFKSNGRGFIVISQTSWVHRQIADLLQTIRYAVFEDAVTR